MIFALFVLFTALCISATAAYYSIVGLMAIFSGAALSIAIMGTVLEVGKLVTASWLYQYWPRIPKLIRSYLLISVIGLMLITSMGIFGYLSKAHLEQSARYKWISNTLNFLHHPYYLTGLYKFIVVQYI